jgi:hypothetical protein
MTESSQPPTPPPGRAPHGHPRSAGGRGIWSNGRWLSGVWVSLAIAAGGAVLGVAGGYVWAAAAPKALFDVSGHGIAYVVNPETTAFIAADAWFSLIAVIGGLIIGLAAYLLGVRRFGPLPAAAALAGATAAAFLAWWVGRNVGLAAFRHRLGTSRTGVLLHQPAGLGAHGALAFWPLAAGAVILFTELGRSMRDRPPRPRRGAIEPPLAAPPADPAPLDAPDQYGGGLR